MSTKPASQLTLKDRLSRLTHKQAVKLLGENGERLLQEGGVFDVNIDTEVILEEHRFVISLPGAEVTVSLRDGGRRALTWVCTCGEGTCVHGGGAFSLILEEKTPLGLAVEPPEPVVVTPMSEEELVSVALEERRKRAIDEKMRLQSEDPKQLWTDYRVTNALSGKSYRVALRGWNEGDSFCTCPDFRKNTLGTCKHILYALMKVEKRFPKKVQKQPFQLTQLTLHLLYGPALELRLLVPDQIATDAQKIIRPLIGKPITDLPDLFDRIRQLERLEEPLLIYPDAEEYIDTQLNLNRIEALVREIRKDPTGHPLRQSLLKVELLPYQMDGIAFAAGAGRAVLADDMGLGKTIQGIGVAELLAQHAGVERVLVIAPASLKSQWRSEIDRFCDRRCQVVLGGAALRAEQYGRDVFFTICNYEQVLRDAKNIRLHPWDLIILDEGQRIKNWNTKTTQLVKSLKSTFALVLSGTPLENRLDDLYSIVEFVDDRHLGPAFRFYHRHRVVDEKGRVIGYKNLTELREKLSPVLLRRTRRSVQQELPPRSSEIIRITPTDEQLDIHAGFARTIQTILAKKYLTEMDLMRLQKALLMCRMVANSTYLVDKIMPGYSTKLTELDSLLDQLAREGDRKILLFSEWTTMLNLIEPLIEKQNMGFVRLDGSVPQKKRQALVHQFQTDAECKLFLTTNAGATGLNLQAANTVINVDLPWNPALLEQRISRAHRMGQKQPVQVFILVTDQTLEERMLTTLSAKQELALAALDPETAVDDVDLVSGLEDLKRRLEILLGALPEAVKSEPVPDQDAREQQRKVAVAGGQMLTSAFQFLSELMPKGDDNPRSELYAAEIERKLASCLTQGEDGELQLTVNLPDKEALKSLSASLARLISINES